MSRHLRLTDSVVAVAHATAHAVRDTETSSLGTYELGHPVIGDAGVSMKSRRTVS